MGLKADWDCLQYPVNSELPSSSAAAATIPPVQECDKCEPEEKNDNHL